MKAKEEDIKISFSRLGKVDDLKIFVYADAALGNVEDNLETKSVMGYFIALVNSNFEMSPLHWKTKIIEKVAEDIKTAETLALETAIDDALYLSGMINEIYNDSLSGKNIPIIVKEDSKSLIESIYSTKKVKRKTMRVVISSLQQRLKNGEIEDIIHVTSKEQLADVLTKRGPTDHILLSSIENGILPYNSEDLQIGWNHTL